MIISAVELKRLSQQLSGAGMEEKTRESLRLDRENRYKLSRARVKNWDNTISGQRRKKLEAREARAEAEEAARTQLDREFEAEEAQRRKQAIDRAKELQYHNQDSVRAFHSRVLLYQVLKERDMQVKIKNIAKQNEREFKSKNTNESEIGLSLKLKVDENQIAESKRKTLLVAQEQMLQAKLKSQKEYDEKLSDRKAGQELAKLDLEYRKEQKELEIKKKLDSLLLRDQLQQMRQDLKNRAMEEKKKELIEDQKTQAWVTRKTRQTDMKKEIEQKWFEESILLRDKLGEAQAKLNNDADTKLEEQISKAVAKKEAAAKKEDELRLAKKTKQQSELKTYFIEYLKNNEEKKIETKRQEKDLLNYYLKIREEAVAEQREKKNQKLEQGKQIQEFHKQQIQHVVTQKKREKLERLQYDRETLKHASQEDIDLKNYMQGIANEPWARENPRLIKYIEDTTNGKPKSLRHIRMDVNNTRERLGFAPTSYEKVDLARMNPIVTGNILRSIGEDTDNAAPYAVVLKN